MCPPLLSSGKVGLESNVTMRVCCGSPFDVLHLELCLGSISDPHLLELLTNMA